MDVQRQSPERCRTIGDTQVGHNLDDDLAEAVDTLPDLASFANTLRWRAGHSGDRAARALEVGRVDHEVIDAVPSGATPGGD